MANSVESGQFREIWARSFNGLRLYAREYGPVDHGRFPLVCLPGITRTCIDFHALALGIANDPARPRQVVAIDYRGRGRSDWDPDWTNYDPRVEATDLVTILMEAKITRAHIIGTSRGGAIAMGLGAFQPALLQSVILNDIGPTIEIDGLRRIAAYIGAMPQPKDFLDAIDILKHAMGEHFPALSDTDWLELAHGTWRDEQGELTPVYDPALMNTLAALTKDKLLDISLPPLWAYFDTLRDIPVMAIRGELSDLLTPDTLEKMQEHHPGLVTLTIPGQGHAPLLSNSTVIASIAAFLEKADTR